MKKLQELLDQKADKKLRNEIKNNPFKFLGSITLDDLVSKWGDYSSWGMDSIILHENTRKIIFDKNVNEYRQNETEIFLKTVSELEVKVEDIKSEIVNLTN